MAVQYVILTNSDKGHRISGFAHSIVSAANNSVGTKWRQALIEYLDNTTSEVPSSVLPVGRQSELDAGSKFEWPFTVGVNANDTPAAKEATVQAYLVAEESNILSKLENRLDFWGKTGTAS